MIYYISDPHFGHANIIRLCSRPFDSVEEMDKVIMENWNLRVSDSDDIYILGDLMFRNTRPPEYYLERLKGRKHLMVGNHDRIWMKDFDAAKYFESIDNLLYIVDEGRQVVMCHYPMMTWPHAKRSFMVFGHIHNNFDADYWPFIERSELMLNAGVEVNGYMPVTLDEMKERNAGFKEKAAESGGRL